ncbi:DUF4266 domain-containing protein [Carboxylicivirga sp. A043]|uniref:DUF4266 domain-containing protein n=1 Tax=Carboxylicivirga litoralis TaxID=2816963 RepID=UPI0021CAF279|nr:DUF4266 domain-containing protein [Carboxylicivirga sp. A043]MCU4156107.1 DUF4266 domain-containing protein [Carboxylicivirga sp. A043]
MKKIIVMCIGIITIASLGSCVAVKGYEQVNLNDPDMALADKKARQNIKTFHAYREAAAGANGGKTGGGCGCN